MEYYPTMHYFGISRQTQSMLSIRNRLFLGTTVKNSIMAVA